MQFSAHPLLTLARMRTRIGHSLALAFTISAIACGASPSALDEATESVPAHPVEGDVGEPSDAPLVAVDDSTPNTQLAPFETTTLRTTGNLNLRAGPATTFAVLTVIPLGATVTLLDPVSVSGFLEVSYNGIEGWCSQSYLEGVPHPTADTVDVDGPPSPDNAILRAQLSVGFSYWWGGAAWLETGPTASTAGTCSGGCPSCTHGGSYGADCSGMVGKAWQFGTKALNVNSHPHGTSGFVNDVPGKWSTIDRAALKPGDALVYNQNGAGHIVLWESGDGWGASSVYECKGCAWGCVHDTRAIASNYKAIRRAGF